MRDTCGELGRGWRVCRNFATYVTYVNWMQYTGCCMSNSICDSCWICCRKRVWSNKCGAFPQRATKTMKAMKAAKAMTKGGIVSELATATDMKKSDVSQLLGQLSEIGAKEVK
ncbi:unnamed protein product, partial [Effrenium voratum]